MLSANASRSVVAILIVFGLAWSATAQQRERDRDRAGDEDQEARGANDRDNGPEDRDTRSMNSRLLPPRPERPERDALWYLGVEVEYTDVGAQLTSVARQSPARRAGLETRDVIVTVDGYQVGRVNGRLYTLDRELELRADRRGNVPLLVQNRRNGQLSVIPVRLELAQRRREPSRVAPLTGTISASRAIQLTRNAVLIVRLVDVTDRRLPPAEIAQRTYRDLGPFPIPFELPYDPDQIEPNHVYALDAQLTVNGFAALRTRERYPVLDNDAQQRVHMTLEPVRR